MSKALFCGRPWTSPISPIPHFVIHQKAIYINWPTLGDSRLIIVQRKYHLNVQSVHFLGEEIVFFFWFFGLWFFEVHAFYYHISTWHYGSTHLSFCWGIFDSLLRVSSLLLMLFRKSLTSIANKPLGKGNSNLEWGLELVHFKTKMLASNCLWLASKHKSLWMIQVDWGVKACLLV